MPATRTTAVTDDKKEGPSTDNAPIAPSRPIFFFKQKTAYEISNHARRGHESRHNLTYWRYGDYAGVGPGPTAGAPECARSATGSRRISSEPLLAMGTASPRKLPYSR